MAETLPDEVGVDLVFSEDQKAADAAREIKACLTSGETSKALLACDRMLTLHPDNRLFEGLRLEAENKEREIRLEFIRRLSSELETMPDLDTRIEAIQKALNRYPAESQLLQLLKNATARRDLFNAVIAEARNEELSDGYTGSLKRWYLLRTLYPTLPGLVNEIRRVESLADTQRRMRRRAEFVDKIFQLSSTGEYTRAVYQCINALAENPNDAGLLNLKKSIEEKAEHVTELRTFISEGVTFLQGHEVDAALESFAKARAFDESNLQVRYLIGIALLEKARFVMSNDRRKLNLLLDEAKSFIPGNLQTLSFELEGLPDENWEKALVRVGHPGADLQQADLHHNEVQPSTTASAEVAAPLTQPHLPESARRPEPDSTRDYASFRKIALFGLVLLGALSIVWLVYAMRPSSERAGALPPASVHIKATPEGAAIFVDGQKVGESQVQTQLSGGAHTVSVSLAGFESQTVPVDFGPETKDLQIDLRPILLDVHVLADEPGGAVWLDDQPKGDISERGITISGVKPGVRIMKVRTPTVEAEISFEFLPGKIPTLRSLPPPQIASVLFAGSADGKSHVECNCAPFGLRVGDLAELIRAGGLDVPLVEGEHRAELWLGKSQRKLKIRGSRSPAATIAVFSSIGTAQAKETSVESSLVSQGRQDP